MKYLILLIVLVAVGIATNPAKEDHVEAVKDLIAEKLNESMLDGLKTSKNKWEAAGSVIGMSLGISFLEAFLQNMVFRRNYLVFSLTELRLQGNSKVVGIGALGNVWIFESAENGLIDSLNK